MQTPSRQNVVSASDITQMGYVDLNAEKLALAVICCLGSDGDGPVWQCLPDCGSERGLVMSAWTTRNGFEGRASGTPARAEPAQDRELEMRSAGDECVR
jgi:hypothetical protein